MDEHVRFLVYFREYTEYKAIILYPLSLIPCIFA